MADQNIEGRPGSCSAPGLSVFVTSYCFRDAPEAERRMFEAHLLDCDFCWAEVRRLSAAVEALRADKELIQTISPADVSAVLGLSSKLSRPFAGHTQHIMAAAGLYALLYALGLLTEVSYAFDRLGGPTLKIAPLVFLWMLGTSILGLWLTWNSVLKKGKDGLGLSIGTFVGAALVLYEALCFFLPDSPITQARIQTYTAQAAYMKGIRYTLPLAAVFLLVPFHFVVSMQRELRNKRHRLGLALLSWEKWAVSPPGAFYIKVRALWVILLALLLISIPMTSHLFDNLKPGPFLNLFTHLMQMRWVLYFGLGIECLAWYSRALNEIKGECLLIESASQRRSSSN